MAARTELRFVSLREEEESDECARYRSGWSVSMTSGCEGEMIPLIDRTFMQSCFLKNSTRKYINLVMLKCFRLYIAHLDKVLEGNDR